MTRHPKAPCYSDAYPCWLGVSIDEAKEMIAGKVPASVRIELMELVEKVEAMTPDKETRGARSKR